MLPGNTMLFHTCVYEHCFSVAFVFTLFSVFSQIPIRVDAVVVALVSSGQYKPNYFNVQFQHIVN